MAKSAEVAEYSNCIFAERKDSSHKCPGYDTKQTDGEASVMLELWGMRSTHLLLLLPGWLWPGVVVPDLSMGQIKLNHELMLNWIVWNKTVDIYKWIFY